VPKQSYPLFFLPNLPKANRGRKCGVLKHDNRALIKKAAKEVANGSHSSSSQAARIYLSQFRSNASRSAVMRENNAFTLFRKAIRAELQRLEAR
jgi:hypothetical protein